LLILETVVLHKADTSSLTQ